MKADKRMFTYVNTKKGTVVFKLNCNYLLSKYFSKFSNLISKYMNKSGKVSKEGSKIVLSYALTEGEDVKQVQANLCAPLIKFIADFTEKAIKSEVKNFEFIPLYGLDSEIMKEHAISALKNKRDLFIFKDISEYEMSENKENNSYKFNQFIIKYENQSEYSDAVLYLVENKVDEFRKIYEPKLDYVEWY